MRSAAAGSRGEQHGRGGFTLLEIVIVAAVLLTLAAATVPTVTALLGRESLMTARGDLISFLSAQRRQAIDTGRVRWLRWEADGHHVVAGFDGEAVDADIALPDDAKILSESFEGLPDRFFETVSDPSLADAAWSQEVLFYPDGTATEATLEIELPPRTETLTLHAWSGIVE